MVDISIVNGVYKPTYNWGAPPCREQKRMLGSSGAERKLGDFHEKKSESQT